MRISVIIPTFNAAFTIGKCLLALRKQTLKPAEVIVVDDGSTDSTLEVLSKFKIQIFKQKHMGAGAARNLGAKKAAGDILAFIDSDCVPGKNWLKNIAKALSEVKIGAVGGGYSSGIDHTFWQQFCHEELFFRRRKRQRSVMTFVSNNMACRKALFWQVGGFPKQYPVCEDMLFSYKISRHHPILWLKNNGVKHHFKISLKDYLKHQYFFGKESTLFFLENPKVLVSSNHQGKQLHLAIGTAFLSGVGLPTILTISIFNQFFLGQLAVVVGILLLIHFFLYWEFLTYLNKKGWSILNLTGAYLVSLLRDFTAAFSFFDGLTLYIKRRKL